MCFGGGAEGLLNIWVVKYLCPVQVDPKDTCALSNWPILDVLKLLEFCLGLCFWQALALCPVVLGGSVSTSKVLGHSDLLSQLAPVNMI